MSNNADIKRIVWAHNAEFIKRINAEDIEILRKVSTPPVSYLYRDKSDGNIYTVTVFPWGEVWADDVTAIGHVRGWDYIEKFYGYKEEK